MSYIWGVGMSVFGKQPQCTLGELAWSAVRDVTIDAETDSVEAVYVGTCFGEPGVAQRTLWALGLSGIPILTFENACASSTVAFHEAVLAVEAGRFAKVLVVGLEHLTSLFDGLITPEPRDFEGRAGMALPALYGLIAARYVDCFGLTPGDLASVSVKNHAHGLQNDRAQHRKAVTAIQVLESRPIADPLTLLQCCALADGAAAVIVGANRRSQRDVRIAATAFGTGNLWNQNSNHVWGYELVKRTAAEAYERAGLGPNEVDLAEVHDAFTIGEIVATEALGFAPEGEGVELLRAGETTVGGRLPVNPSGGLLSRGHPLGATGCAQLVEAVLQLRGEAGPRQVVGAQAAIVETMGGGVGGIDGNGAVVALLTV